MTDAETDALIAELLGEYHREEQENEELLALLDGPFKDVRDQNHVEADRVLVWDRQREPVVESVPLHELLLRYPCGVRGAGWTLQDLGEMTMKKGRLYAESVIAHELSEEDPTASPTCGTVVLVVRSKQEEAHRWLAVKAAIDPEAAKR